LTREGYRKMCYTGHSKEDEAEEEEEEEEELEV
jgi:hypothetical protein